MNVKALVLHKNRPALISEIDGDKIMISLLEKEASFKVREKDIELLHPGPCSQTELSGSLPLGDVQSAWELLTGSNDDISIKELSELIFEAYTPQTALAAWKILEENFYFIGDISHIRARSRAELEAEEKKRNAKEQEIKERNDFFERLRKSISSKGGVTLEQADRRFLQDVEALAYGSTDKSRTLKELGWSETPVEAHRLLLACGIWSKWENPHPARFGLSLSHAKIIPPPLPEEDRLDLTGLSAFAIDSSWSTDPDDAISLEGPDSEGRLTLWVHVADPACSITPGSPADIEAQNRGATLYLPEGSFRMLAPEALPMFALGFGELEPDTSRDGQIAPALSFKLLLNPDLSIVETQISPSRIKVTRLSYEQANDEETLAPLFALAEKNIERRLNTGAVMIEMPEAHISVQLDDAKQVSIEPVPRCSSMDMVRECMLLAGEGAAQWAVRNRVPFPFISQEAGELPNILLPELAGAFQRRRSMRSRALSVKPGVHWGLGLDMYTQVTSPLRRYLDLLCHQQIRSFLKGNPVLDEDEVLLRMTRAEVGAAACAKAERASRSYWTAVYLADKIGSSWEGIILDNQGGRAIVIIPDLGLETQVPLKKGEPNEKITLTCLSVKLPEGEILFTP